MKIIKAKRRSGVVEVPASKSQTIRALLIAAFSHGVSEISHPLLSADTRSAISAIETLGAEASINGDLITVDASRFLALDREYVIDAGNSGTTELLLMPMIASKDIACTITGDDQLLKRPIGPLVSSLQNLGASVEAENGFPPVQIKGPLLGGSTVIECRTSQYLSGLLLGCPMARGASRIDCSLLYEKPYVRMTLGWLDREEIEYEITDDLEHVIIPGGQSYKPISSYINGDFSSASFFFAVAMLSNSLVTVKGLDRNDPQGDKRILEILSEMGADVAWNGNSVTVTGPDKIKGGVFDINDMPDALPVLSIIAAGSDERVSLVNVPQARIKETDRIHVMAENLATLGVPSYETPDGIVIEGNGKIKGGEVKGYGDHRVIMALAVASSRSEEDIIIDDERASEVTFPSFFSLLEALDAHR